MPFSSSVWDVHDNTLAECVYVFFFLSTSTTRPHSLCAVRKCHAGNILPYASTPAEKVSMFQLARWLVVMRLVVTVLHTPILVPYADTR